MEDKRISVEEDSPAKGGITDAYIEALADAYHGGWRKSKKHAKETNFYGLNRSQIREYFDKWYKGYRK